MDVLFYHLQSLQVQVDTNGSILILHFYILIPMALFEAGTDQQFFRGEGGFRARAIQVQQILLTKPWQARRKVVPSFPRLKAEEIDKDKKYISCKICWLVDLEKLPTINKSFGRRCYP